MAISESAHDVSFLVSEANGELSRDNVTLKAGENLNAGAVLGKITSGDKYVAFNPDAVDGSQTAAAILMQKTDATAADAAVAIINRLAEVNSALLVWGAGVDSNEKAAALVSLAAKFIIAR